MNDLSYLQKQLLNIDNTDSLFIELGLKNLNEDKKQKLLASMILTVINRILLRIEPILTKEDRDVLSSLERNTGPEADNQLVTYLISVVPNFDKIAAEEMTSYKEEMKVQIASLMKSFDEEQQS